MHPALKVFLVILGILLLLPSLYGFYFAGSMTREFFNRHEFELREIEPALWLFSYSTLTVGCLGLIALSKATQRYRISFIARVAGWATLILGIGSIYFLLFDSVKVAEILDLHFATTVVLWIGISFGVGGLPALLIKRPTPEES
jgi:hypothetical protein